MVKVNPKEVMQELANDFVNFFQGYKVKGLESGEVNTTAQHNYIDLNYTGREFLKRHFLKKVKIVFNSRGRNVDVNIDYVLGILKRKKKTTFSFNFHFPNGNERSNVVLLSFSMSGDEYLTSELYIEMLQTLEAFMNRHRYKIQKNLYHDIKDGGVFSKILPPEKYEEKY